MSLAAEAAVLTFPDAVGELPFPQNDIAALQTEVVGSSLKVTVVYAKALGLLDQNFGDVFIDGDLDPGTGVRLGADCIVEYILAGDYATGFLTLPDRTIKLGAEGTSAQAGTNSISFVLPLSLWGGNPNVRLFAASAWTLETTLYDRVPDAGWLDTRTGLAVFPTPGNPQVRVAQVDSPADAVFPNLSALEARVSEGNLLLWLTFAHGVEQADLQAAGDTLMVHMGLDLDHRLWTGFCNNHEDPPTFGFDRDITLMLSHLFDKPYGELRWQIPPDPNDPTTELLPQLTSIGLGGQSADTRFVVGRNSQFHTSSNQIFLSIPLGYLGSDEGEMYLTATAFLEATLSPGHSDSVPDAGALDTTVGLLPGQILHPVATCVGNEMVGLDDPNDSIGFGLQGDEIVSSHACALSDGGLKITADLESLEMSDLAFVNLFVDADGDANTGVPLDNGTAERMGVDFYLTCRIAPTPDPGIVTASVVDFRRPPLVPHPRRVDQLVSVRLGGTVGSGQAGARYSITLPPELLGSVGGATVRYLLTTTQQSYSTDDQEATDPPGDWWTDNGRSTVGVIKVDPADKPTVLDIAPDVGFYAVPAPASLPLHLASVVPNRGPVNGGRRATLFGSSFAPAAEVRFGGALVAADKVHFVSSGELSVLIPAHAAGTVEVSVRNPDGAEAIKPSACTYGDPLAAPPVVWQVEPSLGAVSGGNAVQIHGLNFVDGAEVRFAGRPANAVSVLSPFLISALAPPGQVGAVEVEVANSDGQSGRLPEGYNYGSRPPAVWTLFPDFGPLAGGTAVTIVGEGFQPGVQAKLGGSVLGQLQIVSDRVMTGITPAHAIAEKADLTLTNAEGAGRVVRGAFQYGGQSPGLPPPTILGIMPYSSPTEGGEEVTILGTDFQEGAAVFIDSYPIPIRQFFTGLLKVISPPHSSGLVPIKIVNPDGQQAILPVHQEWDSFSYNADQPYISLVSPMDSPTVGGERIMLLGDGFKAGATVEFGGVAGFDLDLDSGMILVTTPPHPPGAAEIKVTNPNGKSYTYYSDIIFGTFGFTGPMPPAPVISSVATNRGPIVGGTRLTLQGANLFAGARVFFGAQEASSAVRLSSSSLAVTSPPALRLGSVDVLVRNADGQQAVLSAGFDYVATTPQVATVTPNNGTACGGTRAVITGSGFMPESMVLFAGNAAVETVFVDEHTLNLRTPPGFPGAASVRVINPGGVSNALSAAFTYTGAAAPAPQVQAVLPASGPVGGGTAVSIIGQGFLAGAGAGVGGRALFNLELRSSSLITGVTPPGAAGAFDVTVTNRDGQASSKASGFIYVDPAAPAPRLLSVTPAAGPVVGNTGVVLVGEHFQPGARVCVGRYPLARVEFISAQELRGQTTTGAAGSLPVLVWNPDGKTNSPGVVFQYVISIPTITLLGPGWVGSDFSFSFQTMSNATYAVERNDDLRTTNWQTLETVTGNGALRQCLVPMANGTQRFFRVRQP